MPKEDDPNDGLPKDCWIAGLPLRLAQLAWIARLLKGVIFKVCWYAK